MLLTVLPFDFDSLAEPVSKEDEASKKERVAQMTDVNGNVDQGEFGNKIFMFWLGVCDWVGWGDIFVTLH